MPNSRLPWFFLHIPKTGGTSLAAWLRQVLPPAALRTAPENRFSRDQAAALAAALPEPGAFIFGHAEPGACRVFRDRAAFITLLRQPSEQIVSHFLHALRDPAMPQHAAANALGFRRLVCTYPWLLAFQTLCLFDAFSDPEAEMRLALSAPDQGSALHPERHFARMTAAAFAHLEAMRLVGTLEQPASFVAALAGLLGIANPPPLAVTNRAAPEQAALAARCLRELEEVTEAPALAPFFAMERATYARARALAEAIPGIAPVLVHRGALGCVFLGENFIPDGAAWRTGASQRSMLFVERPDGVSCRLRLRIEALHFLLADEIMLCGWGRWLTAERRHAGNGRVELDWTLPADADARATLLLYLQWNRYPAHAPFYPELRLSALVLSEA